MRDYDTSGGSFYSETYPNPGSQAPDQASMAQDTQSFNTDAGELPQTITPQYSRYSDSGQDTFAPSSVTDPTFQPATQLPQPVQTGFQFQPWMLLAAGAALVLYLRSEK